MKALKKSVMKYFKFSGICFTCNLCVEKCTAEIEGMVGDNLLVVGKF